MISCILWAKNFQWQKICFHCGSNHTIKKGRENGHQRWFCKDCHRYFIGRHRLTSEEVNHAYLKGHLTVSDLAREFGVSRSTIHRKLNHVYEESLPHKTARSVVLLMDATYWGRNFGIIIMKDSIVGDVLWYKFISKKETIADYKEGVEWLEANGYTIVAVVCDGLKGLRAIMTGYKFQLCQFHQVMSIKTKLTMHPKLEASRELLSLSRMLCHTDKDSFVGAFEAWENKWDSFLRERAEDASGKSHYIHKELRSAYLSLKRNMPWLWTWYDYPELNIPNTNNALESLNSDLKAKLNLHKGISKEHRKVFIQDFIKAHKPCR